jgi:Tfp pilus tip-associated adhesin PilY1
VGDINGDNVPEIVYGGFDKCMYVWEPDGTPAAGWWNTIQNRPARCMVDTIWSSPSLADLNGDGVKDIVIGTDSNQTYAGGSVWAFTGNNTKLWRVETTQIIQSAPAVGDINGDGYPEIVVGTGTYYPQGYKATPTVIRSTRLIGLVTICRLAAGNNR